MVDNKTLKEMKEDITGVTVFFIGEKASRHASGYIRNYDEKFIVLHNRHEDMPVIIPWTAVLYIRWGATNDES